MVTRPKRVMAPLVYSSLCSTCRKLHKHSSNFPTKLKQTNNKLREKICANCGNLINYNFTPSASEAITGKMENKKERNRVREEMERNGKGMNRNLRRRVKRVKDDENNDDESESESENEGSENETELESDGEESDVSGSLYTASEDDEMSTEADDDSLFSLPSGSVSYAEKERKHRATNRKLNGPNRSSLKNTDKNLSGRELGSRVRTPALARKRTAHEHGEIGTIDRKNKESKRQKLTATRIQRKIPNSKTFLDPSYSLPLQVYYPKGLIPDSVYDTFVLPPEAQEYQRNLELAKKNELVFAIPNFYKEDVPVSRSYQAAKKINMKYAAKRVEFLDMSLIYDADEEDENFVKSLNETQRILEVNLLSIDTFESLIEILEIYFFSEQGKVSNAQAESKATFSINSLTLKQLTKVLFYCAGDDRPVMQENNLLENFPKNRRNTIVLSQVEDVKDDVIEYWKSKHSKNGPLLRKFQQHEYLKNWSTDTSSKAMEK